MAAVLVGLAGRHTRGEDPQAHPPGGAWGEPAPGVGGHGPPGVGAEALGPTARVAEAGEHGRGLGHSGGGEGVPAKQPAAVALGHGERITREPVARCEVARELGAPDLMGGQAQVGGLPRLAEGSTVSSLGPPARAAEDRADHGARGSWPTRLTSLEPCEPLLGAPRRGMLAQLDAGLDDRRRRLRGAGARWARALLQSWRTGWERAVEPRVARLPTDAVQCAPLGDRQRPSQVIGEAWGLLVQG